MQTILLNLALAVLALVVAASILLAPSRKQPGSSAAPAIDPSEQAETIEAMRPARRERPVIALVTLNRGTEVTDLLVSYGVLRRADVADVTVVAERVAPVRLYSTRGILSVDPHATTVAFDERYPGGADYVVVPAMEPRDDPFVVAWIAGQHRKGAKIVSVCAGSLTVAKTGLLDGRRATTHWYYVPELLKEHPRIEWVRDRRYVTDRGVTTSTGITASMPTMLALVQAIGGRAAAERIAGELGIKSWDARHRTSSFRLTLENKKTFIRNWLTFWRHEVVGIPVVENADEIALALSADTYARTALAKVVTVGTDGKAVRSRQGLTLHPDRSIDAAAVDRMLPAPATEAPALTIERELARIAARYDRPTAAIVALTMEYPWTADQSG